MNKLKKTHKISDAEVKKAVKTSSFFEGANFDRAVRNKKAIENLKFHDKIFSL